MKVIDFLHKKLVRYFRTPFALITTQYALMIEYRAEIILWAISGLLPLIMLGIWQEAGISSSLGLDKVWLTRYFISAFVVRQFTAVWVMVTFEEDHLEGRLSPYLLQPLFPFWRYYSSHIAEQISRIPIVGMMLLLVFILKSNSIWLISIFDYFVFLVTLFLAFTVRFLLHWLFSMICFWNDRASAIERLLLIPYLFLSGLVAPLEAFPSSVSALAYATPFPYILSFPAKILAGQNVNYLNGFTALLSWLAFLLILSYYFWKKGIKIYSGMGL